VTQVHLHFRRKYLLIAKERGRRAGSARLGMEMMMQRLGPDFRRLSEGDQNMESRSSDMESHLLGLQSFHHASDCHLEFFRSSP
jgi:hypothetical protein